MASHCNDEADKVFIKGLEVLLSVGIYDHEKTKPQRVIINVIFDVTENSGKPLKSIDEVVSYEKAVEIIREVTARRHYDLLEELAEEIVKNLKFDNRIERITLSLEKPDIIEGAVGVGVEITRGFTA
jgi:dihydroneopterin aldolase